MDSGYWSWVVKAREGRWCWCTLAFLKRQCSLCSGSGIPRRHSTGEVLCRNVWMSSHEYKDIGFQAFLLLWATQVLLCPGYLLVGPHFSALQQLKCLEGPVVAMASTPLSRRSGCVTLQGFPWVALVFRMAVCLLCSHCLHTPGVTA